MYPYNGNRAVFSVLSRGGAYTVSRGYIVYTILYTSERRRMYFSVHENARVFTCTPVSALRRHNNIAGAEPKLCYIIYYNSGSRVPVLPLQYYTHIVRVYVYIDIIRSESKK